MLNHDDPISEFDPSGNVSRSELSKALSRGDTWVDTESGAVVKVLDDARANGTIKVLLYRLMTETVTDPTLGNRSANWTYDAVGNPAHTQNF